MAFDHWCSPPEGLDLIALLTGWREYDLDPASNPHSRVPARVALLGPPTRARERAASERRRAALMASIASVAVEAGGGVRLAADGLFSWPATARVYLNPPYSSIRPWVALILLHALAGGEGASVLPLLLDSAWAHALLEARIDIRRALEILGVDAPASEGDPRQTSFRADPDVQLYAWRGRLSFLDPRADCRPGQNGRTGSLIVTWNAPPLEHVERRQRAREVVSCL